MSLTGHRVEQLLVEHLTHTEASLGYLDGVTGGSVKWRARANLKTTGSITLEKLDAGVNVSRDRIRLWWQVNNEEPWPLGTFVIAAPLVEYAEDGSSRELTLLDKLTIIREDHTLETVQVLAGTNLVEAAVSQVLATGESRVASTPSAAIASVPMSWPAGTPRISIVNDLLSAARYKSLWTDGLGQFRIEPYVEPSARATSFSFITGELSIHTWEWSYETSLWEATNTVVLISQAGDDEEPLVATAVDDNPDSPTSTVSMGRVLNPIVEENVEAESQEALQLMANRILIDNSNVFGIISIGHRPLPLWYDQVVRYVASGIDVRASISEMSLNLVPGSLMQAEWRQI